MEFEKVRDIIVETLGCDAEQVKSEATLSEDLGADSLDVVELIMSLEDSFGITISDDDAAKLSTVGAIVDYLEKLQ